MIYRVIYSLELSIEKVCKYFTPMKKVYLVKSHMVILVVLLVLAILVLIAFLCIIAVRELLNNCLLCHHIPDDDPINTKTYTGFAKFIARCNSDINILCLKLPEEDRKAVHNAFRVASDQIWERIGGFVDQQRPLNSETVYDEYSDMVKDIKSFLDMFFDKYPELDREKFNQSFSEVNSAVKNAIDKIVKKDAELKGIDVTSRNAECKSLGI